jgi:hypothetical protein
MGLGQEAKGADHCGHTEAGPAAETEPGFAVTSAIHDAQLSPSGDCREDK